MSYDRLSYFYKASWPGWIRTTTAGSKDRCPAIRRRARKSVFALIIYLFPIGEVPDLTQI